MEETLIYLNHSYWAFPLVSIAAEITPPGLMRCLLTINHSDLILPSYPSACEGPVWLSGYPGLSQACWGPCQKLDLLEMEENGGGGWGLS